MASLPVTRRAFSTRAVDHERREPTLWRALQAQSQAAQAGARGAAEALSRWTARPNVRAIARVSVQAVAISLGLGLTTGLALHIVEQTSPPEAILLGDPSEEVRAVYRILGAPPTVQTVWHGAETATAARAAAPAWADELLLSQAAQPRPLSPPEAFTRAARTVSVDAPPLWSPYLEARGLEDDPYAIAAAPDRPTTVLGVRESPALSDLGIETAAIPDTEPAPAPVDPRPAVAIVVTAIGINPEASEAALVQLPPEIALAIAPIADLSTRWTAAAQRLGRITLVEAPLEPEDYPRLDPGPLTLLADDPDPVNLRRLNQALAAAPGVDGVSTYLGGRFLSDPDAAGLLASAAESKGLLLFENDGPAQSALIDAARRMGADAVRSSVVLDNGGRTTDIRRGLRQLEQRAKRDGRAVGVAVAVPGTINALDRWLDTLDRRGLRLITLEEAAEIRADLASAE